MSSSPIATAAEGSPPGPVIEIHAVQKSFANGIRALGPVSIGIERGEFLNLFGPSGCGKSTLLKLMARLVEPSEGTVHRHAGKLGFVFQDATLMPWASILANVRLPLDLGHVRRAEANRRAELTIKAVGLEGFGGARPRQLSGGMRMRASLARALVDQPDLLLLDEPFAALDEITRNRIDSDLLALWRSQNFTVVFVTHSIHEAVFLSTRILVMSLRPGRVVGELCIDEPQPRTEGFRSSPRFLEYCSRLHGMLARASVA